MKTSLRPDLHEFFPAFSPEELDARLARMPFWQATLLTERNIRRARALFPAANRDFGRFLALPPERQRHRLADVLSAVGLDSRVVSTISVVPRHLFVPRSSVQFAYLNVHIPTAPGSCLTPPGLVAVMLEALNLRRGVDVVEFGAGSGYHLTCAAGLVGPQGRAVGIDVRFPDSAGWTTGRTSRVRGSVFHPPLRDACTDVAYATCYTPMPPRHLARLVRPGGTLQYVTALTRTEFESEPDRSWLRTTFAGYQEYLKADPQRYGGVRTYRVGDSWRLGTVCSLYDVSFVPAVEANGVPPAVRELELG